MQLIRYLELRKSEMVFYKKGDFKEENSVEVAGSEKGRAEFWG